MTLFTVAWSIPLQVIVTLPLTSATAGLQEPSVCCEMDADQTGGSKLDNKINQPKRLLDAFISFHFFCSIFMFTSPATSPTAGLLSPLVDCSIVFDSFDESVRLVRFLNLPTHMNPPKINRPTLKEHCNYDHRNYDQYNC